MGLLLVHKILGGNILKKNMFILSSVLILTTLAGCTTNKETKEKNSIIQSQTSSEQVYPIQLPRAPETFNAYYNDEQLDIKLSSTNSVEKVISKEVKENESSIVLKAELPLTNLTTINMHTVVNANPNANDLANLYTEKIMQFFEAGATKDFSEITNYSDFFYQEFQDEIIDSTFISEDMDKMTLKNISAYDKILTINYQEGQIFFTVAGYIDYFYAPDYLDRPLLHENQDIGLTFVYDPTNNTWLLNKLDWFLIFDDLPDANQTDKFNIKIF